MDKTMELNASKKPVVIVSVVTALCLLGDSMLYIVLPIFWREVGLASLWQVGVLLAINRFVRLPLNPLIGWLYKSMPIKTGLLIAVIVGTLTTIGYGFLEGFWFWLLLRSAWGLAWSLLRMGGYFTVIHYSNSSNRGYFMGVYNGLFRLGSLFGMLFGGLLASLIGLSQVALIFGIVGLMGIPLITTFIPHGEKVETETSSTSYKDFRKTYFPKSVVKVIVSGLLVAMLIQGLFTSTLSFVVDTHFTNMIPIFGMIVGATTLSGILQGVRWTWEPFLATRIGRWSDGRWGRLPIFLTALIGAAVGFVLIPLKLPLSIWLIIVLCVQMIFTSLNTLMDSLASDIAQKSSVVTVMTMYTVSTDLGAAMGPLLGYALIELEHGLFLTYLSGTGIFLLIAGLWFERGTDTKQKVDAIT